MVSGKWLVIAALGWMLVGCGGDDNETRPDIAADVSTDSAADAGSDQQLDVGEGSVQFIDLRAEEISATRAVIRFDTSIPTTCEVEFGFAPKTLDQTAVDPDMEEGQLSAEHRVPLEDLLPETTYYWRGKVEEDDGTVSRSEVLSFTTLPSDGGPNLTNYAALDMGTTVTDVSSNFGGGDADSTWGIHNAFDGQMSSEWATNGDGDDAFVELDLGQERTITHFGFRSREMTDGTSIVRRVQLIVNGTTIGPFDTPDPAELYTFELESALTAQTIRVEAVETSGGNTGAREIQLLAP